MEDKLGAWVLYFRHEKAEPFINLIFSECMDTAEFIGFEMSKQNGAELIGVAPYVGK